MQIIKRTVAIALILVTTSSLLLAQKPSFDWNRVEQLKPGAKIVVVTKNGREFIGTKRQSTGDSLFMKTRFAIQGSRTISLTRDEIAEVSKRKSRWWLTPLGFGIGLAAGIAIGGAAERPGTDDPGLGKLMGGLLGSVIGLGVGGVVSKQPKIKRVYVAP